MNFFFKKDAALAAKIIIIIILMMLYFSCTSKIHVETPAPVSGREKIQKDELLWAYKPSVNIRNEASENGKQLAQLVDGDSVIVLTNKNGWYQIRTIDGTSGWVRSDLLGPKTLSVFPSAVRFIKNLKEKEQTEVYFDKKLYHKRIYISFPARLYTLKTDIENRTRQLIKRYQQIVYGGDVTVRVLKPGSDEAYMTLEVPGFVNADPILPVVPFGRIEEVDRDNPSEIKLSYSTPKDISDQELISTARALSSEFPITYRRVEITFKDAPYSPQKPCRLWFLEDKNGEDYKVDACN
jgi:hypothetical protein